MRLFDCILWDLDGTIMDTKEGILDSVKSTIYSNISLENLNDEQTREFIGPAFEDSISKFYNLEDNEIVSITNDFKNEYKKNGMYNSTPMPHIYEVMKTLRDNGIKMGLATYKDIDCAQMMMQHFDFMNYFDCIYGSVKDNKLTKTDIMKKCLKALNINDINKVLMIGDTEHDLKASINIGCKFVGVKFGFGYNDVSDEELNNPLCIKFIDDLRDLLDIVIK